MNFTLISLNALSLISKSPMITFTMHNQPAIFNAFQSHFSNFFTNIFYINSQNHKTKISNSFFSNTLNSAISLHNDGCSFGFWNSITKNDYNSDHFIAKNHNVVPNDFPDNFSDKRAYISCPEKALFTSSFIIAGCIFNNCYTTIHGGAIEVQQLCTVMIHETQFIGCHAKGKGGALFLVQLYQSDNQVDLNDKQLIQLDIQYCCFQDCYNIEEHTDTSTTEIHYDSYGIAVYSAAKNTTLFYASAVNCSDVNELTSKGAQFDLQATKVTSKNVNITGGNAISTCGIEYRYAKEGYYMFQTMSKMNCTWATAFTNFDKDSSVKMSLTNFISNTISKRDGNLYPGLIFIKNTSIVIENFYFYNTTFIGDNCKVITKQDCPSVTLVNCFIDDDNKKLFNNDVTISNEIYHDNFTLYPIEQLLLGGCQGSKNPGTLVITSLFTPSFEFSETSDFSDSLNFSESIKFSESTKFSNSNKFSESTDFSNSNKFSESTDFSNSNKFSESTDFSNSNKFSGSTEFSESNKFSKTEHFSESDDFTKSNGFSESSELRSSSYAFTKSNEFTVSNEFSLSDDFSSSYHFSPSTIITARDVEIGISGNSEKDAKLSNGQIGGIAVAAIALIGLIVGAALLFQKRNKAILDAESMDLETANSEATKFTYENPIYKETMPDDPFANDFNENVYEVYHT